MFDILNPLILQLGPGPGPGNQFDPSSPWMYIYIISLAVIPVFMLYGQKMQSKVILNDISKSLLKLKKMKEDARIDAIDYVKRTVDSTTDPSTGIDRFLEYFTIMPVDLDPNGLVRKLEHIMRTRDDRMKAEVQKICVNADNEQQSRIENILEAASALNMIYKVVRHFYLMGKRTTSMFVLVQLQMVMPILLEEATALQKAIGGFEKGQPIGDGIGPLVVGKIMIDREKKYAAKETVFAEADYKNRKLYLLKAEGPAGSVGRPGEAITRLTHYMGVKLDAIIMIDAALKLEGEKTGEVAEGIGAAIGGIGVEKYQIEEVATQLGVPLYAIVVKQSIQDAITVMRKEVFDSCAKVESTMYSLIEDKTEEGESVLVVGVGNTMGVAQ